MKSQLKKKKEYGQMKINELFVGSARETLERLIESFHLDDVGYPTKF